MQEVGAGDPRKSIDAERGNMPVVQFAAFSVVVPDGWEDITESLDIEDPPITFARPDGVGALQFSIAAYSSGERPDPSPEDLLGMVEEFGQSRGLGSPGNTVTRPGPLRMAAGSFLAAGDFVRAWYVSDGLSFALATYLCEEGSEAEELAECEQIIGSLAFITR
jgi:hypothetical protein